MKFFSIKNSIKKSGYWSFHPFNTQMDLQHDITLFKT